MPPDVDREGCEAPEVFGEEIIDELVAAQERGLRDGPGFFDHRAADALACRRGVLARMAESARHVQGMEVPPMTTEWRLVGNDESGAPANRW